MLKSTRTITTSLRTSVIALTGLNKAIKTAEGALLKQLKADRLAVIAYMQDAREETEENGMGVK